MPVAGGASAGGSAGHVDVFAVTEAQRERYIANFNAADPNDEGKLTGVQAKDELLKSGLDKEMLKRIWFLADQDRDGMLDLDEYIIAVHLAKVRRPHCYRQQVFAQRLTRRGARIRGRVFFLLSWQSRASRCRASCRLRSCRRPRSRRPSKSAHWISVSLLLVCTHG